MRRFDFSEFFHDSSGNFRDKKFEDFFSSYDVIWHTDLVKSYRKEFRVHGLYAYFAIVDVSTGLDICLESSIYSFKDVSELLVYVSFLDRFNML